MFTVQTVHFANTADGSYNIHAQTYLVTTKSQVEWDLNINNPELKKLQQQLLSPLQLYYCFVYLVCAFLCLIRQTLDSQSKQNKNKSTNKRKSSVSLSGKLLEPRWRLFFPLFSFAIFVGSICIFQKSTKENSPGAEMADLHIEDSTEGE